MLRRLLTGSNTAVLIKTIAYVNNLHRAHNETRRNSSKVTLANLLDSNEEMNTGKDPSRNQTLAAQVRGNPAYL